MSENKLDGSKGVIMLGNNNAMSQIKGPEVKESVDDNINSSEILDLNTLDEPFMDTLKRDFIKIYHKVRYVLLPKSTAEAHKKLRNWDLWGPLLFCVFLSIILSLGVERSGHNGIIFITVFVIVWFGGFIVSLNCQFLGANISLFQSVCVLGYCLFPIDVAALLIKLLTFLPFVFKFCIAMAAFGWSSYSSVGFVSQLVPDKKKILASYPIFIFYLFLSWFILTK